MRAEVDRGVPKSDFLSIIAVAVALAATRGDCYEIGDFPFVDTFEDSTQTSNTCPEDPLG
jgi:hypothetical protein